MKFTVLSLLVGVSLFGTASVSQANDQTLRIPQGRGQYVEIPVPQPARTTVALYVTRPVKAVKAPAARDLRPVIVQDPHGRSFTLFETVR